MREIVESGPKGDPEVFFCSRPAAFPPKGSPQMAQNLIKPEEIMYSGPNGAPEVYFCLSISVLFKQTGVSLVNNRRAFW